MPRTSPSTLHPATPFSKLPSTSGNFMEMSPSITSDKVAYPSDAPRPHDQHVHPLAQLSSFRKHFLLLIFSVATGVGLAVAQIRVDIDLAVNQMAWIITSYSLCFAALLLFAGRLSDLVPATIVFEVGFTALGVFSLITSFVTTNKYGFLILRGLGGLAGALTIPSSYHLLVHMFPQPAEQQKKLALLGTAAGLGNVLGLVIAGLAMLASYHWFFRIIAIASLAFSAAAFLLLPKIQAPLSLSNDRSPKWKRLDFPGVILIAAFLICFILALTNGPIEGWGSASFIAPIIIAFVCAIAFFVWEAYLPARSAALPSSVYQIKNFIPSAIVVMIPMSFWFTSQLHWCTYYQLRNGWTPLHVAAVIVPQGVMGLLIGALSQFVPQVISKPQFTIPIGVILIMVAEVLQIYSYGGQGNDYWRYVFPAFIIGSSGAMLTYFGSAISIVMFAPPEMSGVISAFVQVVSQVGGAIALAVQGAFETEDISDWMKSPGRCFWFVFAWSAALGLQYVIFWRRPGTPEEEHQLARERIARTGKGEGVEGM